MTFKELIKEVQKFHSDIEILNNKLVLKYSECPNLEIHWRGKNKPFEISHTYCRDTTINILNFRVELWQLTRNSYFTEFIGTFTTTIKHNFKYSIEYYIKNFRNYYQSLFNLELYRLHTVSSLVLARYLLNELIIYRTAEGSSALRSATKNYFNSNLVLTFHSDEFKQAVMTQTKIENDLILRVESLDYFKGNQYYNNNLELFKTQFHHKYAIYERDKFVFQTTLNELLESGLNAYDWIENYYEIAMTIVEK